ncbi:MAG TPA: hypothetical protein IAC62_10410 [Candidatus Pelethocola excrementipullorum]|nr:hypothetical protein [Candidatus Pelethocola excrementipullorum]
MDGKIFEMMQLQKQEKDVQMLISCNEKTETFGLALTPEDANELIIRKNNSLVKHKRVEFGEGMLPQLVFQFCDSQYINQEDYLETLTRLQDIFFLFKNESEDLLTDDELLNFMYEQFETICYGDLDYLEGTCLERFSKAVRAGYRGYHSTDGRNVYEEFSEENRWDKELYMEVLRELFWR